MRASPLLIALDIDGTILHHDGHLSPRVRQAVATARDAGHHLVLATGRSVVATQPVARELGLTQGYAVCSNGALSVVWDEAEPRGYRVVDAVTLDPEPVVTLLRREIPTAIVAVEEVGVGFKVSRPFPDGELTGEQTVVGPEELVAHPATRVTFRSPEHTPEEFIALVERIGLHGVSYAVGYTAWLDLAPEGVSKASGLEQVRRALGVEAAGTVAVGDQRNDLQMLQWAGVGIAMGQAPPEVQAVADRVTGTVGDDGLAVALEELLDQA